MARNWSNIVHKLCGTSDEALAGDPTLVPSAVTQNTSEIRSPLHALIIGVDDYKSGDIKDLSGAVNDAKAFQSYLTEDLSTPQDNITTLFNHQATRIGIISAFQAVCKNEDIKRDDPIVIYYSGHGAEIKPPPDRSVNGPLVQCIIPHDASTRSEATVCPIPDFTIGALLEEIAEAKGDNITVVFDCCHSAGGSREGEDDGARFIEMDKLPSFPAAVDSEIVDRVPPNTETPPNPTGFAKQAMSSHVLLAACAHGERAYENVETKRGYFTSALLELLRRVKVDNLTYKGCMQRLPTLDTKKDPQNPVCEGHNIGRLFFNAKVPGADSSFILVKTIDSKHILQAGITEGVSPGCTFALYENHVLGANNPALGTLVAHTCDPFHTVLRPLGGAANFALPPLAYARQTGYGSEQALDVHFTDDFVNSAKPSPKWKSLFSGGQSNVTIRPADQAIAQLTVGISEDKQYATFTLSQQAAIKYGFQSLTPPKPIPATADLVSPVLRAVALWSWHLRRTNGDHPFQPAIEVEFYKLRNVNPNRNTAGIFEPTGENLNIGGEAHIVVKDGDFYGFKIVNNTTRDLYAYPIYFSISDQSIIPKYNNVCGNGRVDPSLPHDQSPNDPTQPKWNYVTVGYGSGGVPPLQHLLGSKQDLDVGIYKIFLTTSPADFSSLELHSPLELTRAMVVSKNVEDSLGAVPMWDTISMTIVQHRHAIQNGQDSVVTTKADPTNLGPILSAQSSRPLKIQADSAAPKFHTWFESEALTEDMLSRATHLKLRTRSMEMPPAKGSASVLAKTDCTWFDLIIIGSDGIAKCDEDEESLEWRSHTNVRGGDLGWIEGVDFDRTHEIWGHLESGDKIQVNVNAQYRGWANIAEEGNLVMW